MHIHDDGVGGSGTITTKIRKQMAGCPGVNFHHLPEDLVINFIFRRLPLKCLFRCNIVCKAWQRLVHDTHVQFGGTAMTNNALALLCSSSSHSGRIPLIKIITPEPGRDNDSEGHVNIIRRFCPGWFYCDATNGFVLYSSQSEMMRLKDACIMRFCVCNPLTCRSFLLPLIYCFPWQPVPLFSMLVFDPTLSHHYKVISFFGCCAKENGVKLFEEVCLFSSEKAGLGWCKLDVGLRASPNEVSISLGKGGRTVCLHGYAYRLGFKTGSDYENAYNGQVLSFHVREEHFGLIDSPPATGVSDLNCVWRGLDKAEGCLQYIYNDGFNISIWRLLEDGRSWALRHSICLSDDPGYPAKETTCTCALAVHGNEEVVYFIGVRFWLYVCYIKRRKIEYYRGRDHRLLKAPPESLRPFLTCAINPDFRRGGV